MKKAVFIVALIGLAGCTTPGDIRRECAAAADSFAAEVTCFENMVAQDPSLAQDSFVQEYMLSGKVLAEKVARYEMSENEARLELTQDYNNLMLRQQQYNAYNAMEMERLRPRFTSCRRSGDQVICDTY